MDAQVLSFDLKSDFAFFRKPDINDGVQFGYNMLHKPALLGILGAIMGMEGYREKNKWPEYYQKLKDVKVGIGPLSGWHERGNFKRTILTYTNTVGYANDRSNLIIKENTLIRAAYRIYLLLEEGSSLHQKLSSMIREGESYFVPYLGKNEMYAWWEPESVRTYALSPHKGSEPFRIESIFMKASSEAISGLASTETPSMSFLSNLGTDQYLYFERLPIGFDEELKQYEFADFVFSDSTWNPGIGIDMLYAIKNDHHQIVVQLF